MLILFSSPSFCTALMLISWIISLIVFWKLKHKIPTSIENQSRSILYYGLISGFLLMWLKGKDFGIPNEYLSNLTTEIIGILITVFLIDTVYNHISSKNEELYRKLSLKSCRMLIYTYCANWLYIYESNNIKLNTELLKYNDLESFFKSDDFYRRINAFDFNKNIEVDKTYAKYYNEKYLEIADRFQGIISKYASKLSHKDLILLEHFGGRAYFFTVFAVMKFISEVKFSHTGTAMPNALTPFNNSFNDVKRENFNKHFQKLIELINAYNDVVDNDYEKWTLFNINALQTIVSANINPNTEW